MTEKFALIEYRLAKSGEMVVMSVLPVTPAGGAVNTSGNDGAKLSAGVADSVKNAGLPLNEMRAPVLVRLRRIVEDAPNWRGSPSSASLPRPHAKSQARAEIVLVGAEVLRERERRGLVRRRHLVEVVAQAVGHRQVAHRLPRILREEIGE